jgi:WD40 repeat protein
MSDNTLQIWNFSSNSLLLSLQGYFSYLTNIKFLSSGLLAASSSDSTVSVWNITTGQALFTFTAGIYAIEELMNGNLATSGADFRLKIWSLTNGSLLNQYNLAQIKWVLKQTTVNDYLASGSTNGCIYLWDIDTLTVLNNLCGHSNEVYILEMTSSGLLVSGSLDNCVCIWNLTALSLLNKLTDVLQSTYSQIIVVSDSQLMFGGRGYNGFQFINISLTNSLSLGPHITLPNSYFNNFRLLKENVIIVANSDNYVNFINLNSTTVTKTLHLYNSQVLFMDIISKRIDEIAKN